MRPKAPFLPRRNRLRPLVIAAIGGVLLAGCALVDAAPPAVTLTVNTAKHSYAVPTDFSGLSFETGSERPGNGNVLGYLFSPGDTRLVTLFQNLGIQSLRMGGGSVDDETPPGIGPDGYAGIDSLFQFAQAAGVHVIYSLRLLDPAKSPVPNLKATDAAIAAHIWSKYRSLVSALAIGNEPDWNSYHHSDPRITGYPSYLADWRAFAAAILTAAPGARFVGPDTGAYTPLTYYDGESWTQLFADAEKGSGIIAAVTQHDYVGGGPGTTTAQQAIDNMLSPQWVNGTTIAQGPQGPSTYTPYPWLYAHNLAPVLQAGLPYRITEANDYLTGVPGASNSFASALWALDYMHWWAEHGAAGVNFHNKQWLYTDTIVPNPDPCAAFCGGFRTAPKGYGIKAFSVGGHGYVLPLTVGNPQGKDVTAYAVGAGGVVYVTIINKIQGSAASGGVTVSVQTPGLSVANAAEMVMTDGHPGDAALTTATLGGAPITATGRWLGVWTPLPPERDGRLTLTVPGTTAVVLKLRAAGADAGSVQMQQDGALQVLGTGAGGAVMADAQQAPGAPLAGTFSWQGWTALPAGVAATGGVTVARNLDNTLQAFVPGPGGAVYTNRQVAPDGAWGPWQDLGGTQLAHLVATTNADGSLSVFGIGRGGVLYVDSENAPGVGWSGWVALGTRQIDPGFAVGKNPNGLLEVFGVSGDGHVWADAESTPAAWGTWTDLGGGVGPELAVGRDLGGGLELFGVDSGGRLWRDWQRTPGGAWRGWSALPGEQLSSGIVVGQDAQGRLTVFGLAKGGAGAVWSISQRTPGGAWGPWSAVGGTGMRGPLAVGNTASGAMELLATGAIGDVWSSGQTAGGWSAWTDLGGSGIRLGTGS